MLLDATKFWRRVPGGRVDAFTLWFAYGYDVYEGPREKPPEMDPADEQARDDGALFGDDPVAADRAVNGR